MTTNAADMIADFVEQAGSNTPDTVRHAAARVLLNGLRASLAASGERLTTNLIATERGRLPALQENDLGAPVLWSGLRLPAEEAAVCNQLMWTMLLLDDMELTSGMHPGGPAATAALSVAATTQASGTELLNAIAAGIEAQVAVALAASPEMLQVHGFAPLSVLAPLGAAVASCALLRPNRAALRSGVGIAGMSGVGMWEMGGTPSAGYITASATRAGIAAVRAAQSGFDAPERAWDGAYGAFHAFTGKDSGMLHDALAELGTIWRTEEILFQPYSGDTYSQAPLAAMAEVRVRVGSGPHTEAGGVEEIVVLVDERTAVGVQRKHTRHPVIHDRLVFNSDPQSRVAAAWLRDCFSYDHRFPELVLDAEVAALRERVRFVHDTSVPDMGTAGVEVHLRGGRIEVARIDGFTGSPTNPQTDEGLSGWFEDVATPRIGAERAAHILDQLWGLETGGEVSALLDAIG